MNNLTTEWIRKAEADAGTAQREAAVKEDPNWDAESALAKMNRALALMQDEIGS